MKWFWACVIMIMVAAAVALSMRGEGGDKPAAQARIEPPAPIEPNAQPPSLSNGVITEPVKVAEEFQIQSETGEAAVAPATNATGEPAVPVEPSQPETQTTPPVSKPSELENEFEAVGNQAQQTEPVEPGEPGDSTVSGETEGSATTNDSASEIATEPATEETSPTEPDAVDVMLDEALSAPEAPDPAGKGANSAAPEPGGAPNDAAETAGTSAQTSDAAAAASPDSEAKIEKQADGSLLVDGRFTIRGEGTQEKPYEVPWEFLVATQETYQPRLGQTTLPKRLSMLHEKWVKITGYICFPLLAETPDEMLVMLNQWDGCCIGVPPTPFDAVEVKLAKEATMGQRGKTSGSLTGRLRVDPYLVKGWLVSLYLMDHAALKTTGPSDQ